MTMTNDHTDQNDDSDQIVIKMMTMTKLPIHNYEHDTSEHRKNCECWGPQSV